MKDTTIKLVFAGIITVLGLSFAFGAVVGGLVAGLLISDIVLLCGVFANVVTAGLVYFLGYSNGKNGTNGTKT